MCESIELSLELPSRRFPGDLCRRVPQHVERTRDACTGGDRVSERKACREQPDDLLVLDGGVAMHEVDRVASPRSSRVLTLE